MFVSGVRMGRLLTKRELLVDDTWSGGRKEKAGQGLRIRLSELARVVTPDCDVTRVYRPSGAP